MKVQTLIPTEARKLAVTAQCLEGDYAPTDKASMLNVIRQIGCIQLDPINAVARNPLLILHSRLNNYELSNFEALLWEDKALFEYWAHAASIVLAEDYPVHQPMMATYGQGNSKWAKRVREWAAANEEFKQYMLDMLKNEGPKWGAEFEDKAAVTWESSGWSSARNVTMMLDYLWTRGHVTVSRREGSGFGLKKQWALVEDHMPQWADYEPIPEQEWVTRAAEKSLRALGVGTLKHIRNHFIRKRYPGLKGVLEALVKNGRIHPVTVPELNDDTWYIHNDDLSTLERIRANNWQPSTRLLSPFDNLICDRDRTQLLFDFYFRIEIYVPKAKRQYGYYVLPILHGEKLIGRIDPKMDRKKKELLINAVYAEDDAPAEAEVAIRQTIDDLGLFLGANEVVFSEKVPAIWQAHL